MRSIFISYVRENGEAVDRLSKTLEAYGFSVWLDRQAIQPGMRWADAIRQAIKGGTFFLACFSREYVERSKTYMNEELTLAIDELRQRANDRAWFIPVLLSACEIPDRAIGGGETLRSFQHVNLHQDWDEGMSRLLASLKPEAGILHRLERKLQDKSARARIAAAEQLAAMGATARSTTPVLLAALNDDNVTVVRAVVDAVLAVAGPTYEVIERLLGFLTSEESSSREMYYAVDSAQHALINLGASAIDPIIEAIDADAAYEKIATDILSRIRDRRAMPHLLPLLAHHLPSVRASSAEAIGWNTADPGRRKHKEYCDTSFEFRESFKPEPPDAATKSALALLLQDESPLVRRNAARALGVIGRAAANLYRELLEALRDPDEGVRRAAADALGQANCAQAEALPELVAMLPSKEAAFCIGCMGSRASDCVPILIDQASAASSGDLPIIIEALGRIGDRRAIPLLLDRLSGQVDRAQRISAAAALTHFSVTEEIISALEKTIHDPAADEYVLFAAATTLGRFDSSKALPTLTPYLRHQHLFTRKNAADAIGRIGRGAKEAVPELISAMSVAGGAEFNILRALRRIGTPEALEFVATVKSLNE